MSGGSLDLIFGFSGHPDPPIQAETILPAKGPDVDDRRTVETRAASQDHSDLETTDFQYNVSVVHPKLVAYAKELRIAKPDREEVTKDSFGDAALTEGEIRKGRGNLSKHEHSVSMVLFIMR